MTPSEAVKTGREEGVLDGPCGLCGKQTNSFAGDPLEWNVLLPTGKIPGVVVPNHVGCVMERIRLCTALRSKYDALREAGAGLYHTLARYHDRLETHYIGRDDKDHRCEGCGTIEHWEKTVGESSKSAPKGGSEAAKGGEEGR